MLNKKTLYIYNINAGSDGSHKIHEYACQYTPDNDNSMTLDFFDSVSEAEASAKEKHPDLSFTLCDHCSK